MLAERNITAEEPLYFATDDAGLDLDSVTDDDEIRIIATTGNISFNNAAALTVGDLNDNNLVLEAGNDIYITPAASNLTC